MTGWPRASHSGVAQAGLLALALLAGLTGFAGSASARTRHHYPAHSTWHGHATRFSSWHPVWRRPAARAVAWSSPTDPLKDAELVEDGRTGRVLYARNADLQRHPASLTKMMTLYLLFDALKKGQVNMNTPVYISQHAASQKPTKLGIAPGDSLPVDTAIRAAVVLSANDIAVAIAEALGGTESHFGELMTEKARELGMRNTFYHNASGLPDDRQITTASDLGILARHLAYDFPQYFHYFSLPGFSFRGRVHLGHDNLLGRYPGADGIKTGYTNASGFNLVSSVVRGGVNIIGVVMGGYSAPRRDHEMMRLLDWTFAQINQQPTLVARAEVPWQSMANAEPVTAGFQFGAHQAASPPSQQYAALEPKGEIDEDSAESAPDRGDEIANLIQNAPPKPQVGLPSAQAQQQPPPQLRTAMLPPPRQTPYGAPTAPATAPPPASPPASVSSPPPAAKPQPQKPAVAILTAPAQVRIPDVHPIPAPMNVMPASIPQVQPMPRDNAVPMEVASVQPEALPAQPESLPSVMPIPRANLASDSSATRPANLKVTTAPGTTTAKLTRALSASVANHGWTIQIGAFGDIPTARARLASYAEHSLDMLGQAERIIVPFQASDGKTMYRARFGTFAEQEARSLCAALTQRGESCFAATLAR